MAKFEEALKWLLQGKAIKRTNWRIDGEVHLIFKDGKIMDSYGNQYSFNSDDVETKNWIIYKEKSE